MNIDTDGHNHSTTTTSNQDETACTDSPTSSDDEAEKAQIKRRYVLQELIETERDYVNNLGMVIDGYIRFIQNDGNGEIVIPEDLKNGKEKIIFGNIETIYEFHKE